MAKIVITIEDRPDDIGVTAEFYPRPSSDVDKLTPAQFVALEMMSGPRGRKIDMKVTDYKSSEERA